MKTMEAYTRELYGRIEERKKNLAKRRRLLTGILASAAVFVAAAAVTVPLLGKHPRTSVTQSETIGGKTFTLTVDTHDRYVDGNASYVYAEKPAEQAEDRALFSGLFCFRTGEGLCFAFREDGATYLLSEEDGVVHLPGSMPDGIFLGGDALDGSIYVPATKEVICGLVTSDGICRYDPETGETVPVISGSGSIGNILFLDGHLMYTSCDPGGISVRMCDLPSGTIYAVAEIPRPSERLGGAVRMCRLEEGTAVLADGRVYLVSLDGTVREITVGPAAADISADGGRLFVFRNVFWVDGERQCARAIDVYDAVSGEAIGSVSCGEDTLLCRSAGGFAVWKGCVVIQRNGSVLLWDPVAGTESVLPAKGGSRVFAARAGEDLLLLCEEKDQFPNSEGSVTLVRDDRVIFSGRLPEVSYYRSEELSFDSVEEGLTALFDGISTLPVDLSAADLEEILGTIDVSSGIGSGETRAVHRGYMNAYGRLENGFLRMHIYTDGRMEEGRGWAYRLGFGDWIESMYRNAAELPLFDEASGNTYDFLLRDGVPYGVVTWTPVTEDLISGSLRILLRSTDEEAVVLMLDVDGVSLEALQRMLPGRSDG